MPCWTIVTVQVKDRLMALVTMKYFNIDENNISQTGNTYRIILSGSGITEADFKIEYGLRVAEQQAKRHYGYKVRTRRGVVEKEGKRYQTLFVTNME